MYSGLPLMVHARYIMQLFYFIVFKHEILKNITKRLYDEICTIQNNFDKNQLTPFCFA